MNWTMHTGMYIQAESALQYNQRFNRTRTFLQQLDMKSSDDIQTLFDANRNKTKLLSLGAPLHNDGQALRIITLIWVISV